jgi:hypothetical protein
MDKESQSRNQRETRWQVIFFDFEDGGDIFLGIVSSVSTEYTASFLRRQYSSSDNDLFCL